MNINEQTNKKQTKIRLHFALLLCKPVSLRIYVWNKKLVYFLKSKQASKAKQANDGKKDNSENGMIRDLNLLNDSLEWMIEWKTK